MNYFDFFKYCNNRRLRNIVPVMRELCTLVSIWHSITYYRNSTICGCLICLIELLITIFTENIFSPSLKFFFFFKLRKNDI